MKVGSNKEGVLSCVESYLRDKSKNGLYEGFEYIGDSISTQDLIMAEQDSLYMDYLVVEIMSVVYTWSDDKIKYMISDLSIDLVSKGN